MAKKEVKEVKEKKEATSLRLKRGADGKLATIEGVSPTMGIDCKILPMTYGQSRQYESFGENVYMWSDEEKLQVLNEHVIEPELDIKDVEDMMNEFDPWTIEDLVAAVFLYSGMQRLFDVPEGNEMAGEMDRIISA